MYRKTLFAFASALACSAAAMAETPEGAAARLDAFLDQFPEPEPGYALVIVTADDVLMNRVRGDRRASTGEPMTADTPIYIASQTKAYMGLLAARLDAEAILDLDSRITDHWPDVEFPEGVDPAAYTLRDLITHEVPMEVELITVLEAYVLRVDPADYPRLIAAHGERRDDGFQYDNIGYNIYGAILETATGRTWQDWLDEKIFDPLGLDQTSARTSDFSLDELSWNHMWQGDELGWAEIRPKTDGMMQSAGGMVTSSNDMGAFLQLQLRGEGPAGSGITAGMVSDAQTGYAETGMEDGRNPYELSCSHYSLGWNICEFAGHEIHIHGGGYTGARTMMAFSPDLGIGIAGFSNSDNQTGWAVSRPMINMYLMFLVEHERAERMAEVRINQYPERIRRWLDYRQTNEAEARADESWGGWAWQPGADDLSEYAGRWSTGDEPYLDFELTLADGTLTAAWGDMRLELQPAQRDLFAVQLAPFEDLEPWQFERDDSGNIVSVTLQEDVYRRVR